MAEVSSIREVVGEQVWYPIVKQTTASVLNHKVAQFAVAIFVVISAAGAYAYWRYANSPVDSATKQECRKMMTQLQRTGSQTNTGTNQYSTLDQQMYDPSNQILKKINTVIEEI